jgi:hypothetical protein
LYTLKNFIDIQERKHKTCDVIGEIISIFCCEKNMLQKISLKNFFWWKSENDLKSNFHPWVLFRCFVWLWFETWLDCEKKQKVELKKKENFDWYLSKLLRIKLSTCETLFIIPNIGYYYKYTTKGVLCIVILQMLKFWKIKIETA